MKSMLLALTGLLLWAHLAFAVDGTALLQQVDRNLQPASFESYRKLINIEPNGTPREFLLYTVKLDLQAKTAAVAYDRLTMWVDKAAVVPTKIECYAATGLLIKTLYFKERKPFDDDILRPAVDV